MANKKTARRAFISSVISLILCCSMLVGTTFAWFTDEVTTGMNTIAAGNLDVELLADGTKVDSNTKLFDDVTLWEPGVVVYENLQIANVGTLDLKYQMSLNFGNENDLNGHKLSEVLQVAILNQTIDKNSMTREQVLELVESSAVAAGSLAAFGMQGELEHETNTDPFAVVIFWAPNANEIDNLYNANNGQTTSDGAPLHIEFGVKLLATQMMSEDDSFDNTYDENAWVDGFDVYTEQDLNAAIANGETAIDVMDNIDLTAPIVIPAAATTYSLRSSGITINLKGHKLTGTGLDVDGKKAAVVQNNGILTLVNGTVCSTGANGGSAIYNAEGASLTLKDVTVIGAPQDDPEKKNWPSYAINSYGTLTIDGADITSTHGAIALFGDTVVEDANVTMNGFGGSSHVFYIGGEGTDVVVNGGTYTHKGNGDGSLAYIMTGTTMTVNGGTFSASNPGYGLATYTGALIVNGGTFDNAFLDWGGPITISGGTFKTKIEDKYVADGFKTVETSNGYMVISENADYVADGVLKSTDGNTYFLSNKAGYDWMEQQNDGFFAGKTVELSASIDFGGETINAIRFWNPEDKTVFDGQGNTLSNFVISNDGVAGLFSGTCTVKNLVVDNAEVTGKYAAVIAGNMYGNIENCTVKNSVVNGTYWQTGILAGQYNAGNVIDCVVEDCTVNGLAAVGALVGIVNETSGERVFENCTVKNCEINQTDSFGGNYDNMFGVAVGLVNIENSTVSFNGCTFEGNTVKGVASDVLCGVVESGTNVNKTITAEEGFVLVEDCVNDGLYLYDTAGFAGTELEVPEGVTAIGNYAFAYNNTIETVVLPATVTDLGRGFDSSAVKKVVLNEGLETISSRAFRSTSALEEVVIPNSVKTIADNAFQKSAIKEIVIPANVQTIGETAFGSSKIEKVTFEGNTSIQGYAFRGCPNLKEVHLKGNDVTFIASTLNGRNSCWFCNGESNNPNTSNITFYVVNETVAARVKAAMGAEAANTPVYVKGVLYEG